MKRVRSVREFALYVQAHLKSAKINTTTTLKIDGVSSPFINNYLDGKIKTIQLGPLMALLNAIGLEVWIMKTPRSPKARLAYQAEVERLLKGEVPDGSEEAAGAQAEEVVPPVPQVP